MDWDSNQAWWKQVERRLNEMGSMVKGNQSFQADRVSDLIEQIDELRQELKRVAERQDKIAAFVKERLKNGDKE